MSEFPINQVGGTNGVSNGVQDNVKVQQDDPYAVSSFGTEIVNDGQQAPTTKTEFLNAGQFGAYFGNGAQKAQQTQYSDLKAGISRQQQLIIAAGGNPPPMPSYEDFSSNKKGAEAYIEALRDYNNALGYEVQIAQTQDVKSTLYHTAGQLAEQSATLAMGLHEHMAFEGAQTRAENADQYEVLKENIASVNENVDQEGAATRAVVRQEGDATRDKVVVAAQRIIKNDRDLATQQMRQEFQTQQIIHKEADRIVDNNNEQTEILDPSGLGRIMHDIDEAIEDFFN